MKTITFTMIMIAATSCTRLSPQEQTVQTIEQALCVNQANVRANKASQEKCHVSGTELERAQQMIACEDAQGIAIQLFQDLDKCLE